MLLGTFHASASAAASTTALPEATPICSIRSMAGTPIKMCEPMRQSAALERLAARPLARTEDAHTQERLGDCVLVEFLGG